MVDLKAKPFFLSEEDILWVKETIHSMSQEEKIGQLFINLGSSFEKSYLDQVVEDYHVGGVRYNPGTAEQVYEQNAYMQQKAKIPLLIASNVECGGNGACLDGTLIGTPVQIGATRNLDYAYEMGRVSGIEGSAVGSNWSFAPVVDINYNWRNPVASTRCFSDNPNTVLEMSRAYIKGIRESGFACAAKHFPGDGVDERDQHILTSVNNFTCEEWDASFGKVYKGLIDDGLQSIMTGHIMLPAYSRKFKPDIKDEDIMPASISPELLQNLLREQLGFNGLILTDASSMVGLTSAKPRKELLPKAIAAGCDMFLFFADPEEDIKFMTEGYQNGTITEERLQDALYRILGLKASLGLHKKKIEDKPLSLVGCKEHRDIEREVADKSITLVKNTKSQLPITPKTHPRLQVVMLGGESIFFGMALKGCEDIVVEELTLAGFEVDVYQSPIDISKRNKDPNIPTFMQMLSEKKPVADFKKKYDAVFLFANVQGFGQQNPLRIKWATPIGRDIPWYVTEVPTVFVSLNVPFHLVDVPMVKTYINAYAPTRACIHAAIEKIMGISEFHGVSPVDPFCGFWDTKR